MWGWWWLGVLAAGGCRHVAVASGIGRHVRCNREAVGRAGRDHQRPDPAGGHFGKRSLRSAGDGDVRRLEAAHCLVKGEGRGESAGRALWHACNRHLRLRVVRVVQDECVVVLTERAGIRHFFAVADAAPDVRLFQGVMAVEVQTVLDDDVGFNRHRPVQIREITAGQRRMPFSATVLRVQLKGRQRKRRRRARHREVGRIHILRVVSSTRNRLGEGDLPCEHIGVRMLAGRSLPRDRLNVRRGSSGSHHEQDCGKSRRYKPGGAMNQ